MSHSKRRGYAMWHVLGLSAVVLGVAAAACGGDSGGCTVAPAASVSQTICYYQFPASEAELWGACTQGGGTWTS